MKIGVVGMGYVGLVTAAVLASFGNEVKGVEIDKKRVEMLEKGKAPFYEPDLEKIINSQKKNLTFSNDYNELSKSEAIFVAVPTPTVNEKIDLSYVSDSVKKAVSASSDAVIAIKSTVIPGTAKRLHKETEADIVSNPEFTKEGSAVSDTMHPDRIVIGSIDENAGSLIERIWSPANAPVIRTTNENAELIKYASNSFLATKISFMNEIANLCEKIPGADVEIVAKGMSLDKRIAPHFLKAGIGFGGSCFPKDTKAIVSFAKDFGEEMSIIRSAVKVNDERIERTIKLAKKAYGKELKGAAVGVLGVAFKAGTDDTRESQALKLAERLQAYGASVSCYDPMAKPKLKGLTIYGSAKECVSKSDIVIIAAEWQEFADISYPKGKIVVDAKRLLDPKSSNKIAAIGLGERDGD